MLVRDDCVMNVTCVCEVLETVDMAMQWVTIIAAQCR